ncbi:MAG: DUF523 domain-containing protein [Bacilli bacterium]|nr:DUF523 domain-containing protein [Bacilli bacterium]
METILVSACLLGDNVKYDGKNNYDEKVEALKEIYDIVPICPEVFGGLPIPRVPSEIKNGSIINKEGKDVTHQFNDGAHKVINIVNFLHIKKALLMDRSPSCGVTKIYNGRFNGTLIDGMGYTAQLLKEKGVKLYTIDTIDELINDK